MLRFTRILCSAQEATSALDAKTEQELVGAIKERGNFLRNL